MPDTDPRMENLRHLEDDHLQIFRHSLIHLPIGDYHHFLEWVLADDQRSQMWLQLSGLKMTARMTTKVLATALDGKQIARLIPFIAPMSIYQVYEVVSDNLALGLASGGMLPTTPRHEILHRFHQVMLKGLQQPQTKVADQLAPIQPLARQVSTFWLSLTTKRLMTLANAYLANYPHAQLHSLEYCLYDLLVANIGTAQDVLHTLNGSPFYNLVRDGMLERYEGSDLLLMGINLPLEKRIELSTDSMLVVATLAYYIAHVVHQCGDVAAFQAVLDDGSLREALREAALLVRLLNDLGTGLAEADDHALTQVIQMLAEVQQQNPADTFEALLQRWLVQPHPMLTRLQKDAEFGEENLLLYAARRAQYVADAIDIFGEHLRQLVQLYRLRSAKLYYDLDHLAQRCGMAAPSRLIGGFVEFHRQIYSVDFKSPEGEYAI